MIADSVAFCRAEGKRVVFDAEHFFDGYRDDPAYALECLRAAAEAGAENVTLCDTNGGSLPGFVGRGDRGGGRRRSADAVEIGIHTHNDAECAVANSLAAVEAGARLVQGCVNGYGERCGNANLASILPALQLKMGFEVVSAGAAREPDPDRPLPRRALQHDAGPRPGLRRPQRLRPQGGHARRRGRRRRQHLRAPRPGAGRQRARDPRLRALGQGDDPQPGRAGRARARRRGRGAGGRAAQGARAPRLPLRGGAGLLRAAAAPRGRAPTSRSSSWRASASTTEKREPAGEVETEATIKVEVDGERYVEVAEGNGPVNALDTRPARGDRRPPPAPRRHRADQLQGADPRRDPRHRAPSPGSCSTPPTASASGGRSASRRTSSRPPGRRWSTRSSTPSSRGR